MNSETGFPSGGTATRTAPSVCGTFVWASVFPGDIPAVNHSAKTHRIPNRPVLMMPLLALVLVHRFFLRIPAAGPVARVTLLIGICIFMDC